MRRVRSSVLSLLLTLAVGLGLATSAFAHRMPTQKELQLQALQVIGLGLEAVCGDLEEGRGPAPCADDTCGLCAATAASVMPEPALVPLPAIRAGAGIAWPSVAAVLRPFAATRPHGQGPPTAL